MYVITTKMFLMQCSKEELFSGAAEPFLDWVGRHFMNKIQRKLLGPDLQSTF